MGDENAGYQKAETGQPLALEARNIAEDGRRFSPSIGRNKDIVRDTFVRCMPKTGRILEIASGTGEHGAHITHAVDGITWTYSDIDPVSQSSQAAWRASVGHRRLHGPLTVDTTDLHWGSAETEEAWTGMFCANMIHIAPFAAATGLFEGARRILAPTGRLMLYGPFARGGEIAPSNARFSDDLKRRDPRWGVRDLDLDILPLAQKAGLSVDDIIDMPANNLSVIFQRD